MIDHNPETKPPEDLLQPCRRVVSEDQARSRIILREFLDKPTPDPLPVEVLTEKDPNPNPNPDPNPNPNPLLVEVLTEKDVRP